jgi:hypothetical protein
VAALAMGLQYAVTTLTRPPYPGTDVSTVPVIQPSLAYWYYYLRYFSQTPGWTWEWVAALAAVALALFRRERRVIDLAVLCASYLIVITFIFSLKSPRYLLAIMPLLHMLTAVGVAWMVRALMAAARLRRSAVAGVVATASLSVAMLLGQLIPVYLASETLTTALSFPARARSYSGLEDAYAFVNQHRQSGDAMVVGAPSLAALAYQGQADYTLTQRGVTALYVLNQHDRLVDAYTGAPAIINQTDLRSVLAQHRRVWAVVLFQHLGSLQPNIRKMLMTEFSTAWTGAWANVYIFPPAPGSVASLAQAQLAVESGPSDPGVPGTTEPNLADTLAQPIDVALEPSDPLGISNVGPSDNPGGDISALADAQQTADPTAVTDASPVDGSGDAGVDNGGLLPWPGSGVQDQATNQTTADQWLGI